MNYLEERKKVIMKWTVKEIARKKGAELLKRKPELKNRTEVFWKEGEGPNFEMLCELLKGNAIPTELLHLGCVMIIMKK